MPTNSGSGEKKDESEKTKESPSKESSKAPSFEDFADGEAEEEIY